MKRRTSKSLSAKELELAQVELALQHQEQLLHLRGRAGVAAHPQHLREHHRAAEAVAVGRRERRPGGAAAQIARARPVLARLLRPGATHVAQHVAVLPAALRLARRHVEVHPLGRREQRRVRVEQRGLPGARGPHEQIARLRNVGADDAVEGAPVESLKLHQAELLSLPEHLGLAARFRVRDSWLPRQLRSCLAPRRSPRPPPSAIRSYVRVRAKISSAENSSLSAGEIS